MSSPRPVLVFTLLASSLLGTGCGLVRVVPDEQLTHAAQPSTTGSDELDVSDLERRVRAALNDASASTAQKLDALRTARRELLSQRGVIVDRYYQEELALFEAEKRKKIERDPRLADPAVPWRKDIQPLARHPDPIGQRGRALLRGIHHARAALFAREGRTIEALREVFIFGSDRRSAARFGGFTGASDPYLFRLDCDDRERHCLEARAALEAHWRMLCDGAGSCPVLDATQLTFPLKDDRLRIAKFVVTKGAARGTSSTVVGPDFGPEMVKQCHDQFETDRIVSVTESRITIERTTWCKRITDEKRRGIRLSVQLQELPTQVTPGAELYVFFQPKNHKLRKTSQRDEVSITAAQLLFVDGGELGSYFANDGFDPAWISFWPDLRRPERNEPVFDGHAAAPTPTAAAR